MPQSSIRRFLKHGTLPQLRVFEASARLGSLTRAALELNMAQPTASVQVKKLSETVGLPLFEQVGKRIYLTEAGRRVHEGCNDVFRALASLEETLSQMRGLASGHLNLAVSTAAKYFAPRLLAAFVQRHPGIEVSLQIHNRSTLIERLGNNEDDLYMFADPPDEQEVVVQAIMSDPLMVFARNDHALAGEKNIAFARLAEEPFLMREHGSGTRRVTLKMFEQYRLAPKIRMELSTDEAIREAILAGLGVSILSRCSLGPDLEQAGLASLDVQGFPLERHWHFVYPVGKQLSVATRAFMDFARVEARSLVRGAFAGTAR